MDSLVTRQRRWWLACGCGSADSAGARRTGMLADWVFPVAPGTEALDPSASCRQTPDTAGTSRDQTYGNTAGSELINMTTYHRPAWREIGDHSKTLLLLQWTQLIFGRVYWTDFLWHVGYRGDGASAIHIRSMLQARTGSWADSWGSYTQPGLPLVRSTSISSCRLVSHLIGSPNRMIAMPTQEVRRSQQIDLLIRLPVICFIYL